MVLTRNQTTTSASQASMDPSLLAALKAHIDSIVLDIRN